MLRQGFHQNNLINGRIPVAKVLANPTVSQKIRDRLQSVNSMLAYAESEGLNVKDSYQHYIATDGKAVSYLVQAAYPDRLEFKTWWFPLVGRVPYLGFFDEAERDRRAAELRAGGYDVATGIVGAFSSLGYFSDPIFEPMLARSRFSLAHLLFHELTHRTLWLPGGVRFNENLAEFVAEVLTPQYLDSINSSNEKNDYFSSRDDKVKFREWLSKLKQDLDSLYKSSLEPGQILKQKSKLIEMATLKFPKLRTPAYQSYKSEHWNNASILGAALYSPDTEAFSTSFACSRASNMGEFLQMLAESINKNGKEPFAAMRGLCG